MAIQLRTILNRRRGATLGVTWQIDQDTDGEIDGTTVKRAAIKPIGRSQADPPGDGVAEAAVFSLSFVAAAGGDPAYIHGEIDAATCAALSAQYYAADLRLTLAGGDVVVTDPVTIDLGERVTEAGA